MNVLIIDDDLKDSKDLEKLCIHYFNKRNIDYKINIELKLNENLDTISNVDILFLDVEIGNNNGIEFSKIGLVAKRLKCIGYFCEPFPSYQRRSNEHVNGIIRRF